MPTPLFETAVYTTPGSMNLDFAGLDGVSASRNDGQAKAFSAATTMTDPDADISRGRAFIEALDWVGNLGGRIQLGAGVYSFKIPIARTASNIRISGRGKNQTELRLVTPDDWADWGAAFTGDGRIPTNGAWMFDITGDNITVEDLTLNSNWEGIAYPYYNKDLSGLTLRGNNNTIRGIRAINNHGCSSGIAWKYLTSGHEITIPSVEEDFSIDLTGWNLVSCGSAQNGTPVPGTGRNEPAHKKLPLGCRLKFYHDDTHFFYGRLTSDYGGTRGAGVVTNGSVSLHIDSLSLTGCATTSSSITVTCDSTAELSAGMTVTGTNIPSLTTVHKVTSPTAFELSAAATGSGTGLTFVAVQLQGAGDVLGGRWDVNLDGAAECFTLAINAIDRNGDPSGDALNGLIEGCEVDLPLGDYQCGFCLFGFINGIGNKQYIRRSAVRNCVTKCLLESNGVNLAWCYDIDVTDCVFASGGAYLDTGDCGNIRFKRNRVYSSYGSAFYIVNGQTVDFSGIEISDNEIELLKRAVWGNLNVIGLAPANSDYGSFNDIRIFNNRIRNHPDSMPGWDGSSYVGIALGGSGNVCSGVRIMDNVIDYKTNTGGYTPDFENWLNVVSGQAFYRGNRTATNGAVVGLSDT